MSSNRPLWSVALAAGIIALFGDCKDVVGPAPVDSISISNASLDLVPGETERLSVVLADAVGTTLTRPVTWSSSAPGVATVDNGLVTGVARGTATITATSEGKSASASVVVEDGGLIAPAGGTISAGGGILQLAVPASAVVSTARLLVREATQYPSTARLVRNTAFEVSSDFGGRFAQPATLTIRYNPADLGGKPDSRLRMYELANGAWTEISQSVVNSANSTVSAPVVELGTYAILFVPNVGSVSVSPESAVLAAGSSRKFVATVKDDSGNALTDRAVAWSTSDAAIARVDAATGDVTAVAPGNATITASSEGVSGTSAVQVTAGSAAAIRLNDGDGQTVDAGAPVPVPPSVVVTDASGFAVAGVTVTFAVIDGGGSITGASAQTDNAGIARVGSWTLGTGGGQNTLSAAVSGLTGSPVIFSATGQKKVAPPAAISIFAGDGQTAEPGATVAIAPAVKVTDAAGNGVAGITVTFSIRSGSGSLTGADAVSDANGIATLGSWKLGDPGGNSLFATLNGVSGSPLIFVATAASASQPPSPAPPPSPPPSPSGPPAAIAIYAGDGQTAVSGFAVPIRPAVKITDASGIGVSGVTVNFSIRSGDGSLTQPDAVSDVNGIAMVGSWVLGSPGGNSLFAAVNGLSGSPAIFVANATLPAGSTIRIVTFGDSNTDIGWAGTNPNPVAGSYVSSLPEIRLSPNSGNSPYQLAGKIEARWTAISAKPITAVNHAISATSTGAGRTPRGAPNARESVGGVTRFEGEVMGSAYPWSGGEPANQYFAGPISRVRSFTPGANDFVYVSMGTNDPGASIPASGTAANLEWMIDVWVNTGHAADHFILTTLAPATGLAAQIPQINNEIRSLASRRGVRLIDLSVRTSDDNSATWRSSADNIGDGIHYTEPVRDWLADQVVSIMYATVPK